MALYLIDTNALLRFADGSDRSHSLAVDAIASLLKRGDQPMVTGQVFVEIWAVATRPVVNNGLGWDVPRVVAAIRDLRTEFSILEENKRIFPQWLDLVSTYKVRGKQVHDARLAAVLLAHGQKNILTFNTKDFTRFPGIVAVHPRDVIAANP